MFITQPVYEQYFFYQSAVMYICFCHSPICLQYYICTDQVSDFLSINVSSLLLWFNKGVLKLYRVLVMFSSSNGNVLVPETILPILKIFSSLSMLVNIYYSGILATTHLYFSLILSQSVCQHYVNNLYVITSKFLLFVKDTMVFKKNTMIILGKYILDR